MVITAALLSSSQHVTLSLLWFKLFLIPLCFFGLKSGNYTFRDRQELRVKATSLPGVPPSSLVLFFQKKPI